MKERIIFLKSFTGTVSIKTTGDIIDIKTNRTNKNKTHKDEINKKGFDFSPIPSLSVDKTQDDLECFFLPPRISRSISGSNGKNGLPIGVSKCKSTGYYASTCTDKNGRRKRIGTFKTVESAFDAYREFKSNVLRELADEYKDDLDPKAYDKLRSIRL